MFVFLFPQSWFAGECPNNSLSLPRCHTFFLCAASFTVAEAFPTTYWQPMVKTEPACLASTSYFLAVLTQVLRVCSFCLWFSMSFLSPQLICFAKARHSLRAIYSSFSALLYRCLVSPALPSLSWQWLPASSKSLLASSVDSSSASFTPCLLNTSCSSWDR